MENNNIWIQIVQYFPNHWVQYSSSFKEHIIISMIALIFSIGIGIVFGCICNKYNQYAKWIISGFQILRIVPSLAVLFLLIPVMGTGIQPALIALVFLAIPPILMNTVTGLQEVPAFLQESAYGLGMSERQLFWKIKLPLAGPMILTGIKTAMVEIIASATLASKIGAGGLGDIIFTGLGLNRIDLLLIGGISVALLSIVAGFLLDRVDHLLFRYKFLDK